MNISHISTAYYNNSSSADNGLTQSLTANAGDKLLFFISWNPDGGRTVDSVVWGATTLTRDGTAIDSGESQVALYTAIADTSTTQSIVATFSDSINFNAAVMVCRDADSGTISHSSKNVQIYNTGTYANPSTTETSVPSGGLVVDFLSGLGWDKDYNNVAATTWASVSPSTDRSGIQHSGMVRVNWTRAQTAVGAGSDITSAWTASAGGPMFVHVTLKLTAVTVDSLDTVTSPVTHGGTGYTVATTGLDTLTSMTVDTVAVTSLSATDGDGTFAMPSRTDGSTRAGYGSKAVSVTDGTKTVTSTTIVNPPATQSYVTLTSVNTGVGYLGHDVSLSIGDQIAFDLAATLGVTTNYIDVDGGVYTDYSGTQIIWKWDHATRITTQINLITGVLADTTPDAFTFTDVTGAVISAVYTSNPITISGVTAATNVAITITGGTYSINGGAYTSSAGNVVLGDVVRARITSSGSLSTAVNAVVTIGGVSDTYTVTTTSSTSTGGLRVHPIQARSIQGY